MKMKQWLVMGAVWAFAVSASQAVYKNIVSDGDFSDWADVPVAAVDDSGDNDTGPDLAMLKIANDETNVYLYVAYHAEVNPNAGPSVHLAFDTDQNAGTGFDIFGLGIIGSEAGWANDFPFAQDTGIFNSGGISGGAAQIAPFYALTFEQEYAIPLSAVYVSGGAQVFPGTSFDLMVYTDPTGTNEHISVVSYTLAKQIEEAQFTAVTLTSVVAMRVENSQEGVLYSLEYNDAFPATNWVSAGFVAEGNGGDLHLFDPGSYSTAKVYRVLSWQE